MSLYSFEPNSLFPSVSPRSTMEFSNVTNKLQVLIRWLGVAVAIGASAGLSSGLDWLGGVMTGCNASYDSSKRRVRNNWEACL
jgi:hypothetical protein